MTGDPRCPDCAEPVSARATYCMHCGAEFEAGADQPETSAEPPTATADTAPEHSEGDDAATDGTANAGSETWLDPDGLLDNSLTVVVGLAAALVLGVLAAVIGVFLTTSAWGFLMGPVVWLGASVALVRQRSVFDTLRLSCYGFAVVLVSIPAIALGPAPNGGTFAGQVLLFLVAMLPLGLLALLVAGLGYWLGKKAPADA